MIRTAIVGAAFIAGVLVTSSAAADPASSRPQQAAPPLTAADAAPFIGEWTLDMQGQNGPAAFTLVIKVDKEKVVGEITGPTSTAAQTIADVTKADKSLVLRYNFDYQGQPIDTVVRLTPGAEGKTDAQIEFASGAYVMSGTATKKDKAK